MAATLVHWGRWVVRTLVELAVIGLAWNLPLWVVGETAVGRGLSVVLSVVTIAGVLYLGGHDTPRMRRRTRDS